MHICAPRMCLVLLEVRRERHGLWNWSYRWLLSTMGMLGTEPGSSARVANALNCGAIMTPVFYCPPRSPSAKLFLLIPQPPPPNQKGEGPLHRNLMTLAKKPMLTLSEERACTLLARQKQQCEDGHPSKDYLQIPCGSRWIPTIFFTELFKTNPKTCTDTQKTADNRKQS